MLGEPPHHQQGESRSAALASRDKTADASVDGGAQLQLQGMEPLFEDLGAGGRGCEGAGAAAPYMPPTPAELYLAAGPFGQLFPTEAAATPRQARLNCVLCHSRAPACDAAAALALGLGGAPQPGLGAARPAPCRHAVTQPEL